LSTHRKELRIIDRLEQTIGLIKCATNEVLSEHPLSKVSFMLKTPDPRVICYIAKDQTKGTIKAARACFFVKLLKEQSQDDIITFFVMWLTIQMFRFIRAVQEPKPAAQIPVLSTLRMVIWITTRV